MKPPSIRFPFLVTMFFIALLLFFTGCEEDSPASLRFNSPHGRIVSGPAFRYDEGYHTYNIDLTVVNDGDGPTAFNIGYSIKLKKGNYIVDRTVVYIGTLQHNESTSGTTWFTKAKSDEDYDYIEAFLYWYDAEGTYYTD